MTRTDVQWHTRRHASVRTANTSAGVEQQRRPVRDEAASPERATFRPSLLYAAAKLYYTDDATQAEVAAQLGTSRATVSRLLAEAKRRGIVRIEVVPPAEVRLRRSRPIG